MADTEQRLYALEGAKTTHRERIETLERGCQDLRDENERLRQRFADLEKKVDAMG